MRGATLTQKERKRITEISTHTPHAGRDALRGDVSPRGVNFNSHAPCGARPCRGLAAGTAITFQLTRPMRGATMMGMLGIFAQMISTHTPHAGRDEIVGYTPAEIGISTHTPHAGRDTQSDIFYPWKRNFNSHAPCGARHRGRGCGCALEDFNSHAPCGARRMRRAISVSAVVFQLTRPMRGATSAAIKRSFAI